MGIKLSDLEAKAMDVLHGVFHEAAVAEPAIWDMVEAELTAVGVPAAITGAVSSAISGLIADYKARQAAPATPAAAVAPESAPAAPSAEADDSAARFAASASGAGTPS